MKIFIITEGSKDIGFGHITRCASLYQAFEKEGLVTNFIINGDKTVKDLLKDKNYKISNWMEEHKRVFKTLKGSDIVVIDSYLANAEFYNKISNLVKLAIYIDDNKRLDYPKGIVVNGTVFAEELNYPKKEEVKYLLGSRYALLRKEFWNVKEKKIKNNISKILITFGGDDLRGMTPEIVRLLVKRYPELNKNVIIGKGFSSNNIKKIKEVIDNNTKMMYNVDGEIMKKVMLKSDIAISSGGQTLYELARVGVPTIAIMVADNQSNNIKGWKKVGFIEYSGKWNEKNLLNKLKKAIERLKSLEVRKNMHNIGRKLVDGKGSKRIIDFIKKRLDIKNKDITTRNAELNDTYKVYQLSNEDEARKNSFNQSKIKLKEHKAWFKRKLKDKNCLFLIAESNNKFIGQVRLQIEGNKAIISISIDKKYRGYGIGNLVIKKALNKLRLRRADVKEVKAYVKPRNIKSIKFFEKAGFKFSRNLRVGNQEALEYIYKI